MIRPIVQTIRSAVRTGSTSPRFLLTALAVCISLTFQVMLPVVPIMVERSGPQGVGGAATAALFIGAVTGELITPWLMSIHRSRRLLVAGQLLTALSSLVYTLPNPAVWAMIGAASTRGFGVGVAIVVSVALLSEVAAPDRRGASIGFYGLALSTPGIVAPSIGVFLLGSGHAELDAMIAFASGLVGALIALAIPPPPVQFAPPSTNLFDAIRRPRILVLLSGFVLVSCSFGGVFTYVPLALPLDGLGSAAAFLLLAGASRAASRWIGGVISDRQPVHIVLTGGTVAALVGLILLALDVGTATVLLAAVAYGAGYGATQTAAYLAMRERGTSSDGAAISALWNGGIDLGSSVGGALIGLAAARYGYHDAIWLLPVVVLASLPLFLLNRQS